MNQYDEPYITGESAARSWQPTESAPATRVDSVVGRASSRLLKLKGVHGLAHGLRGGQTVILIFVDDESVRDLLPGDIEGYPVVVELVAGGFGIQG
jgi:hypothetical protein